MLRFQDSIMIDSNRLPKAYFCSLMIFLLPIAVLGINMQAHAKTTHNTTTATINDTTQGTLLLKTGNPNHRFPAPTLHTDVHMSVTGLIARTIVRQKFENPGSAWVEGIYVFPLPESAAVDHLRMHIGERIIEGKIQERAKAKKIYTKAKSAGKKASLIEQERPNIFTASVANIGPKETIIVEIEYQEIVQYDQEQFSLRFPMVVGPRYIPGSHERMHETISNRDGYGWAKNTQQVTDASRITPHVQHPDKDVLNPVTLTIDLTPGFPLSYLTSTYHPIHQTETEKGHHQITLQEGKIPADRDFELIWKAKSAHAPRAAIFTEHHDKDSYILLMVMPPATALSEELALPRDVTFVIDTSGSMHGTSMEQAKMALQLATSRLSPQDRFNIIQFNNVTQTLFPSSLPVTPQTIQQATRYVQHLEAEGGTEMLPALLQALQPHERANTLRQVIFITDGQIGNEEQLFQSIQKHLRQTRLFTVGIGSAPNSYFMRKAAQFGKGTFTYIGQTTEVQKKMGQLFQKLEHPVVTDIEIILSESHKTNAVPTLIPDLYLGEPIMVALHSETWPDHVAIKGQIGSTPWATTLELSQAPERQGVAVHWARQKIASLMDNRINGNDRDLVRDQIIELAMHHHLVSRYTSLVAVDITPTRSSEQSLSTHAMKTNLPHGQNHTAIFGLSAGATPGTWHILVGFLLLLIASTGYQFVKVRT
ncbi:MAG: marine proteobacterial sortase target protein [Nitrospirales bacterium]